MILKTEEVERRLSSPNNLIRKLRPSTSIPISNTEVKQEHNPPEVISLIKKTKLEGDTAKIPDCVRDLIAATVATSDETQAEIAEAFGVSANTVSLTSRGLIGYRKDERTGNIIDAVQEKRKEKKEKIAEKSDNIHELALDNLVNALTSLKGKVTEQSALPATKLAQIAASVSKVVSNTRQIDRESSEAAEKPRIILFAPQIRQENYYESIDA